MCTYNFNTVFSLELTKNSTVGTISELTTAETPLSPALNLLIIQVKETRNKCETTTKKGSCMVYIYIYIYTLVHLLLLVLLPVVGQVQRHKRVTEADHLGYSLTAYQKGRKWQN